MAKRLPMIIFLSSHLFVSGVLSMTILTIENKCNNTVWPVIFSWDSQVSTTGFALRSGEARGLLAPSSWYGLISGRTLCSTDSTGKFSCITGDCESGKIECPGSYDWSPVTYAYFRIDKGGINSYFISVGHGYNLPLMVVPRGGSYDPPLVVPSQSSRTCISSSCVVDLNKTCPNDLKKLVEGEPVACTSPCVDSKSKQNCKPTVYTQNFERACPFANSYAYKDNNITFLCPNSTDFVITFCPSSNIPNNTRSNNRSSIAPLAGPKRNFQQKLKPILGTTFIATTSLLLIHVFKIFN